MATELFNAKHEIERAQRQWDLQAKQVNELQNRLEEKTHEIKNVTNRLVVAENQLQAIRTVQALTKQQQPRS